MRQNKARIQHVVKEISETKKAKNNKKQPILRRPESRNAFCLAFGERLLEEDEEVLVLRLLEEDGEVLAFRLLEEDEEVDSASVAQAVLVPHRSCQPSRRHLWSPWLSKKCSCS
eukprot:s4881_g3.t1